MMDVLKRYEGTTEVKYFKRYDFWKIYKLKHVIWDKIKKAIIKVMTTLLTHNAVVSILMQNFQKNLNNKEY